MGLGAFLGMTDGGGVSLQPMPSTLCLTSPQRQPPPPVPTSVLNEEKTSDGSPRKGTSSFMTHFQSPLLALPAPCLGVCGCGGGGGLWSGRGHPGEEGSRKGSLWERLGEFKEKGGFPKGRELTAILKAGE